MFFDPDVSFQSAPDHAENRMKFDINAPKSCCRAPDRIREPGLHKLPNADL